MKATEILMREHRLIEQVLDCLEDAAFKLEYGEEIEPDFFIDAARFVTEFADAGHHKKEEDILFVAMTAKNMPGDSGPVAVMLHEHEQGRQLTAGFLSAAEQMKNGVTEASTEVIRYVLDYVNLLRDHIVKEDNILFPMAGQIISAEEMQKISKEFERLVAEDEMNGRNAQYQTLVDKLKSTCAIN